ncbi:hypothetical protein BBO99_00006913 [Phytophthora kernoviae]|uniref:Uncharacterized protein n=2 Tax=Phytophthora kernoviae TaxID=325452 RepID=A0A3R7J515_9STRA|nr:hypothetical protein G195_007776 [Phytophthora kernoviae 00238/432]KAG2520548.1 hypothetical protein JM16_006671 [Phytophthora kernoviae]KAG2522220.1 hypothetical protein JM18_006254 [Phytophthora kernoviae]RLN44093.1 hypothetical protein BBI17_007014 [Phytophthora kernoviae]RLN77242.1 hypothetical protein BBO99_00006913 [Phytophthora kernoviae]
MIAAVATPILPTIWEVPLDSEALPLADVEVALALLTSLDDEGAVVDGASVVMVELEVTKPLVGTVRSQSGGFNSMIDEISDWQLSDAHMSLYVASSGIVVEYSKLKPESSEQLSNELSVNTLANVVYAAVC